MERFTFFWRTESPFSQWHPAEFNIDGIKFYCTEQYMMYKKAKFFNDEEIAQRILATKSPSEHKRLGRKVRNFNGDKWNNICKNIVYEGNYAKFTQNPNLKAKLIETNGTTLVEASPVDIIWGIGLSEEDPRRFNRINWRGKNWLGEILTQVRVDIIKNGKS